MEQARAGYRSRNQDGQLLDKRDDTHMGTIERQYDCDFGVRSDMELGNRLKQEGIAHSTTWSKAIAARSNQAERVAESRPLPSSLPDRRMRTMNRPFKGRNFQYQLHSTQEILKQANCQCFVS